jgi:crotonobetainyl-CoA:carnitine CoA-transferase CaiB-like acyl-CoA transferase
MGKVKCPSGAYRFSGTPWRVARFAPLLGEHNEEIYHNRLGYPKEELVRMRGAGII